MKTVLAIFAIVAIEGFALYQGVNGVALSASIGALAGLGGWTVGVAREKQKNGGE